MNKNKHKETPVKKLFFDIETSYNTIWAWTAGFKLNITAEQIISERAIICICYKWEDDPAIYNITWNRGGDKKLCEDFYKIIKQADVAIGHNIDSFDLKWVKTRCVFHGLPTLPDIKTVDTLKIARSVFKFNSNRLDYLGKFLGFGGKKDTGGIQLWHDIIQKNSKKAMDDMVKYCQRDVILLEKVYHKLETYTKPKVHLGIALGHDKCSCPRCGSEKTISDGNSVTSTGLRKKKMNCSSCNSYFTITEKTYLDRKNNKDN